MADNEYWQIRTNAPTDPSSMGSNEASASVVSATTGADNGASSSLFFYKDGEIIEQKWHVVFVFLAYAIAFIGAYSAIRLLEHGLWRSKREKAHVSSILSKYPLFFTSLILASCTIWSMHFIGMQAVQLVNVDMCYNWVETSGSLLLSIAGVWAGMTVASKDIFAGSDRVCKLKELLKDDPFVTSKDNRSKASWHIHMVALFHRLHWIAMGSILAALGALSMHYVGMDAMRGHFTRQWNVGYLIGSVFSGILVCFAGFWILFRPLHWKVQKKWYRKASAGVIALAVCFLHFLGMLSVTYIADSTVDEESAFKFCGSKEIWGWKKDQLIVVCAAMFVPFVAFLVEHTISNELRLTYRQLKDINLKSPFFQNHTNSGVRISGLDDPGLSKLASGHENGTANRKHASSQVCSELDDEVVELSTLRRKTTNMTAEMTICEEDGKPTAESTNDLSSGYLDEPMENLLTEFDIAVPAPFYPTSKQPQVPKQIMWADEEQAATDCTINKMLEAYMQLVKSKDKAQLALYAELRSQLLADEQDPSQGVEPDLNHSILAPFMPATGWVAPDIRFAHFEEKYQRHCRHVGTPDQYDTETAFLTTFMKELLPR